jgi:ATP-dependent DNA helicase PIF1
MDIELTNNQKQGFDAFLSGKSICITGPAGCGKSFLIKHIKKHCTENSIDIAITALTGAAATIIAGQTLHGWGGLRLAKPDARSIARAIIAKRPDPKKRWITTKVLIIDEISMMSAELFNKLNKIAQIIRNNDAFMGGLQVVLSGDFLQLEPIGIGSDILCFETAIWKTYIEDNVIYMDKIIRQADPVFQKMLSEIRVGKITQTTKKLLENRIISDKNEVSIDIEGEKEKIIPTVLYPHSKLESTGAECHHFLSSDSIFNKRSKKSSSLSKSEQAQLDKVCRAKHELDMCVGSQVMLIWNIDVLSGLVNGSRGVITKFARGQPVIVFDNSLEITIEKIDFEVDMGSDILVRKQFPLILAWALTIHKCQGATLSHVITDLSKVFCNAQSYVTLSRVRALDSLYLLAINYKRIKCNKKVLKYYDQLLNRQKREKDKLQ